MIVYDCLYPWSIGGAERWYRALAERLAAEGHSVTYLTLRQWERRPGGRRQRWWRLAGLLRGPRRRGDRGEASRGSADATHLQATVAAEPAGGRLRCWPQEVATNERDAPPAIPGVRVVTAGPRLALYTGGRRRLWPPLRFGLGVGWHLLRHGGNYDVVHTASFPYWPLLAASVLRKAGGYRLLTDWWEVWTLAYWRRYAGPVVGTIGWLIQRAAIRATEQAFVFSTLHADRLRAEGFRKTTTRLRGLYDGPLPLDGDGPLAPTAPLLLDGLNLSERPFILYAGRHIPEKQVVSLVPALALVREARPEVVAVITGDGPTRAALDAAVTAAGLDEAVIRPGFVPEVTLDALYRAAACLVLPSAREGYGLIVIEAAARGTPSVVVAGPDNAATELIVPGTNGAIARSSAAPDLASAILDGLNDALARRASTAAWFAAHAADLTLTGSLTHMSAAYAATKDDPRACPPLSSPA